jgi:hypothetical protein
MTWLEPTLLRTKISGSCNELAPLGCTARRFSGGHMNNLGVIDLLFAPVPGFQNYRPGLRIRRAWHLRIHDCPPALPLGRRARRLPQHVLLHFDSYWLLRLARCRLRNANAQHSIFGLGVDRFGVHVVGQREAA